MVSAPPDRPEMDPVEVFLFVEDCKNNNMTKEETIDFLATTYNVEPAKTEAVWEEMEEEEEEAEDEGFMGAFGSMCGIKDQGTTITKLLNLQVAKIYRIQSKPLVHRYIERCIQTVMTKDEIINFLDTHCNIEPALARAEWKKLKGDNQQLFRDYYAKLDAKNQMEESSTFDYHAAAFDFNHAAGSSFQS